MNSIRAGKTSRVAVYLSTFLISFHYSLVLYINSTLLSLYINAEELSVLYVVGSIVSILIFSMFNRLIKKLGNYHLMLTFLFLEMIAILGIGFGKSLILILLSFILFLAISPVIYLNLDIFLEKTVTDESITGGVRGVFLTIQNITQLISPFLAGLLIIKAEYWRAYAASVGFLVAALILIKIYLRHFNDARYHARTLWQSAVYVFKHPVLYNVVMAQVILRFFYAWMVIYTPLYLLNDIGFKWSTLGILFAIMLIPFPVLELPVGKMLDGKLSEKKTMIAGFILMAVTVACMPFLTTSSFLIWTTVLFISRVGASLTEISTESFFFRHVDTRLADTITLFRIARPVTYVAAAITASIALLFTTLQWSFLVLAAVMMVGLLYSFALPRRKESYSVSNS
jgi:MFS family permease